MSLLDRLNEDMKQAMRNKEKQKLTVIRAIKSSLQNEAISKNEELSEVDELQVLTREVKQRKDSLQEFKDASREDLVEKTEQELALIETYLPKQLSDEELHQIIEETIQEVGATSKQQMGQVMSAVMPKVKGKADGSKVNQFVLRQLQ
ncbi:GatB/YqeY domain-containing protein [Alkalibacillus haloalkaliphilus]|uniref:GatB/YqeY domain-containing protein n=1 Tax=Alkalibacillus haloalkaliphilus TaxID=94136 RepID=UPI0029359800|nr:GatB/YqeY domain-containing protein [Alkalibacillus haloalkaliphilus]MDV2581029.1 GatB/YqeY domain-containing protein [Alkalibacillus haloalkaliphilus]